MELSAEGDDQSPICKWATQLFMLHSKGSADGDSGSSIHILDSFQCILMEVICPVLPALSGACQEAGRRERAASTPVCPITKNKTGGGGQMSYIISKTSTATSLGPSFP